MISLNFDLDQKQLQNDLIAQIPISGPQSITGLISSLVIDQLTTYLESLLSSWEIFRFKVEHLRGPFRPTGLEPCLQELTKQKSYDLGYFVITIITPPSREISVSTPINLVWLRPIEIKTNILKKTRKYIIRIRSLGIQTDMLIPTLNRFRNPECQCPTELLIPYIDGVWDWALRFVCKICGKSYFCECFRKALDVNYLDELSLRSMYSESNRPNRFIATYEHSKFKTAICHLCRDLPSELTYCHPMYGSKVLVHYGPYVMKTSIEKGISQREAENEIRDILGISHIGEGWVSEVELLKIVQDIFPDEKVIHQASPPWLGLQRFDIFIPDLKIAIEYQGRQHYEPVSFFGGEEGYLRTQERDKRKASLCDENGVTIVYFKYCENLDSVMVEDRLRKALSSK